jgi:uncharacterized surface protein with fasciclin (FAS1) repeats
MRTTKQLVAAAAILPALTALAACGGSSGKSDSASGSSSSSMSSTAPSSSPSKGTSTSSDLVGPGCAQYAKQVPNGAGSVQGMAQDPVATAASNNPLLTTLVATVSGQFNKKVNLVDTLNGGQFTVFAPVDSAFKKLPKKTLATLSTPKGAKTLQTVLTYHVVKGQMSPAQIAGKTLTTVEGEKVKVSGSGNNLEAQRAHVICGGVKTANATVYLIDSVMMPPSLG